jgi:type IV secretory pathway VirB3-like protein
MLSLYFVISFFRPWLRMRYSLVSCLLHRIIITPSIQPSNRYLEQKRNDAIVAHTHTHTHQFIPLIALAFSLIIQWIVIISISFLLLLRCRLLIVFTYDLILSLSFSSFLLLVWQSMSTVGHLQQEQYHRHSSTTRIVIV